MCKVREILVTITLLSLGSGCAQSRSTELSRVRQELHELRQAHEGAQRRIARLENQLTATEGDDSHSSTNRANANASVSEHVVRSAEAASTVGQHQPSFSPPVADDGHLEQRLRSLPVVRVGEIGAAANSSGEGTGTGAQDHGQPPVMIRLRGEETSSERLTVDRNVLRKPDPVLERRSKEAERSYQQALKMLRERRDPHASLEMFSKFLAKYKGHHLADNAVYWSGEAHQLLVQHEQAIVLFTQLLAAYPDSNKVPWAKLRMAQSQIALGQSDAGRALLQRVQSEHPRSEPARIARSQLAP